MRKIIVRHAFQFAQTKVGKQVISFSLGSTIKYWPVNKIIENEKSLAFWHPKPSYKTHILIVPKKRIHNLEKSSEEDLLYITTCLDLAKEVIWKLKLNTAEYSLITNGGSRQKIPQLHFHLISEN